MQVHWTSSLLIHKVQTSHSKQAAEVAGGTLGRLELLGGKCFGPRAYQYTQDGQQGPQPGQKYAPAWPANLRPVLFSSLTIGPDAPLQYFRLSLMHRGISLRGIRSAAPKATTGTATETGPADPQKLTKEAEAPQVTDRTIPALPDAAEERRVVPKCRLRVPQLAGVGRGEPEGTWPQLPNSLPPSKGLPCLWAPHLRCPKDLSFIIFHVCLWQENMVSMTCSACSSLFRVL